jgi:hypothetical protein
MKDTVHKEPTLRFAIFANLAALALLSLCFWKIFGGSIFIYALVNAAFLFASNAIWQARVESMFLRRMASECARGFFKMLFGNFFGKRGALRLAQEANLDTVPDANLDAAVRDIVKKSSRSLCVLPLFGMLLAYCATGFSKDAHRTALFVASSLHLLTAVIGVVLASLGHLIPLPFSRADARGGV